MRRRVFSTCRWLYSSIDSIVIFHIPYDDCFASTNDKRPLFVMLHCIGRVVIQWLTIFLCATCCGILTLWCLDSRVPCAIRLLETCCLPSCLLSITVVDDMMPYSIACAVLTGIADAIHSPDYLRRHSPCLTTTGIVCCMIEQISFLWSRRYLILLFCLILLPVCLMPKTPMPHYHWLPYGTLMADCLPPADVFVPYASDISCLRLRRLLMRWWWWRIYWWTWRSCPFIFLFDVEHLSDASPRLFLFEYLLGTNTGGSTVYYLRVLFLWLQLSACLVGVHYWLPPIYYWRLTCHCVPVGCWYAQCCLHYCCYSPMLHSSLTCLPSLDDIPLTRLILWCDVQCHSVTAIAGAFYIAVFHHSIHIISDVPLLTALLLPVLASSSVHDYNDFRYCVVLFIANSSVMSTADDTTTLTMFYDRCRFRTCVLIPHITDSCVAVTTPPLPILTWPWHR